MRDLVFEGLNLTQGTLSKRLFLFESVFHERKSVEDGMNPLSLSLALLMGAHFEVS